MQRTRLAPCLLALGLASTGGAPDRVVRVYEIGALRAAPARAALPSYGGLLGRIGEPELDARPFFVPADADEVSGLSSDAILDVLNAATPTAGGGEKPSIEVAGDRIVVAATDAQQKLVAAALKALIAAVARPVSVDVAVYLAAPGAAPATPALVAAADAAKTEAALAAAGKLLWSGTLDAAPGALASAGSTSRVPFVSDYNVQVAKKAKIAEPVEGSVPVGVAVALSASAVREGAATHLVAVVSRTDLLGLKRYDTRARDVGAIEIPTAAGARLAASATVPAGATLVLRGASADAQETIVLLRPRATPRPARIGAEGGAPMAILPMHVVNDPAGRVLPELNAEMERVRELPVPPAPSLAALAGGGGDSRSVREIGRSVLLLSARDGELQPAIDRARSLEESELGTVAIGVRVVRANDAAGAAAPNAPVVASAQIAASARRSAGAIVGLQETAVIRYQAQIAEESEMADPVMRAFFRGVCVRARLVESRDGGGTLDVECFRSDFGPRERIASEATDVGDIERVPRRVATLRRTIDVAPGAPVVLGEVGSVGEKLFVVLVASPLGG